jgi:hypothetical protein
VTRRGAWRREGLVAARTGEGCTDGAVWPALVRARWLPHRRPGPLRRRDHRTAQQGAGGAAAGAAAGVRRLSRPPEAPDCSPLAAGGSTVKALLRAPAARRLEAVAQAIAAALAALRRQEAHGWYDQAGYGGAST